MAVADRVCWGCGEKGHTSARCPNKDKRRKLAAIEDQQQIPWLSVVDNEGFETVRRNACQPQPGTRPTPSNAQLGGFIRNSFAALRARHVHSVIVIIDIHDASHPVKFFGIVS